MNPQDHLLKRLLERSFRIHSPMRGLPVRLDHQLLLPGRRVDYPLPLDRSFPIRRLMRGIPVRLDHQLLLPAAGSSIHVGCQSTNSIIKYLLKFLFGLLHHPLPGTR